MTKKTAALVVICFCFLPLFGVAGDADELGKLARARRDAAEKAYKIGFSIENKSARYTDMIYHLSMRWLNASLDLATSKVERIAAYAAHSQRMNDWALEWRERQPGPEMPVIIAACQREAEFWVAREKFGKK